MNRVGVKLEPKFELVALWALVQRPTAGAPPVAAPPEVGKERSIHHVQRPKAIAAGAPTLGAHLEAMRPEASPGESPTGGRDLAQQ